MFALRFLIKLLKNASANNKLLNKRLVILEMQLRSAIRLCASCEIAGLNCELYEETGYPSFGKWELMNEPHTVDTMEVLVYLPSDVCLWVDICKYICFGRRHKTSHVYHTVVYRPNLMSACMGFVPHGVMRSRLEFSPGVTKPLYILRIEYGWNSKVHILSIHIYVVLVCICI